MFQRLRRGGWPYSQPPNVPFDVNFESEQSEGLALWMPWGGGTPGAHRHVDRIGGLAFAEGGTPVWMSDGVRGWSLLFDDVATEYLSFGSAVVTGAPLTLAGWGRPDDNAAGYAAVSVGDTAGDNDYFSLYFNGFHGANPVSLRVNSGAGNGTANTTTAFSVDVWHHLCGIEYSPTSRAVFIDGGGKGTNVTDITPAGLDTTAIGVTMRNIPFAYMSGHIMDARIYNRALTDDQVYQMYANPWELWRPRIRRLWAMAPVAPPAGAMPMAMDHYRRRRV